MLRKLILATTIISVITIGACSSTKQSQIDDVETSGFLGDYSMLEKGEEGQALLRYIKKDHKFSKYTKVMLKPVSVWASKDMSEEELTLEEKQEFADTYFTVLYKQISEYMPISRRMDDNTMVVEVALTNAEKSNATMDTISTVIPVGLVVSSTKELFGGKAIYTGTAASEIKITDGGTGEVIAAAVDERWGAKNLKDSHEKWSDVVNSMEIWGERLAKGICMEVKQDWKYCDSE